MIIGFDGKRAIQNNTGLGNYSRLLVEVLAKHFPDNRYLLFAPKILHNPRMRRLLEELSVDIITPGGALRGSLWRSYGIPAALKENNVNLYHGLSGELPLNIAKWHNPTVLTMHDVIFRRCPDCYNPIDRRIYDAKFRRSVLEATRIIAISERTKLDVMEFYNVPEEKIDVVYQGCNINFHTRPSDEEIERVKKKYGITRPYIITVGTVETRKNQQMAVRGLRGVSEELDLIIVGRRTPYARTLDEYIASYSIGHRVKFLENVEFADLPALYAGAFCSSYTSRYEGFGIPVIESLSVGTPAIVATGSCLEEAGGPLTPAVAPDDIEQWVSVVREMVNFPASHERIAQEGRLYVKRFSDEAMAQGTMDTYLRAIEQYK